MPEEIDTSVNTIKAVEILDYHWENGITTTYRIVPDAITVSTDKHTSWQEEVSLSPHKKKLIEHALAEIDTIYAGSLGNERMADGIVIEFRFTLKDGSIVSTKLNNIRIESYASLTKVVSDMVSRGIEYHDCPLARYR